MMDGSQGTGSNGPPPFLTKTYEMVDDPVTHSLVSWSESGYSFVVWNPTDFARDLLPKYFKHNNFSSFVRQLNTYGFRKVDPEQWEFANEEFIRGQKHLLTNIHRRKPIHSHSIQANPLTETEKRDLEEQIERLNHDKGRLQLELQRHQEENQGFLFQIQSLSQRFQSIEHRQGKLIAFMAQLLQKPDFAFILKEQSEIHYKKRKLLNSPVQYSNGKFNREEDQILGYQNWNPGGVSTTTLDSEQIEKLDSSIKFWETIFYGMGETFGEKVDDFGAGWQFQYSPIMIGDRDMEMEEEPASACSPTSHQSSPHSMEINSSPEIPTGSVYNVNSPPLSSIDVNVDIDVMPKPTEIDINSKPGSNTPQAEAEKGDDEISTNPSVKIRANDQFWAQFLTEAPYSSDEHICSGSSISGATSLGVDRWSEGEQKPLLDHKKLLWNHHKADYLTKQHREHLSPADRM